MSLRERELLALSKLKQSEIAAAVTRGLNPNVPMKDSGISWIGQIPEHWEVMRLKNVVSCNDETLSDNTPADEEITYVEIGDVDAIKGITNATKYKFSNAPSRARRITHKDDIIISTVRTYLKAIAKIDAEGLIVSTGFAVLRPIGIDPTYLAYFTRCDGFTTEVLRFSVGINYPAITSTDLLNLKVIVPPLAEQRAIVEYIDRKCGNINSLISELEAEIAYLKEYKQRLIADAVTGKIMIE